MSRPTIAAQGSQSPASDHQIETAYEQWNSRQERRSHPAGTFDNRGRWYPAPSEEQPCCAAIRTPSAAYPYSLLAHCRSAEHVAALKNGCYYSIYDGETEYVLGKTIADRARQGHGGGIYVYTTEEEARHAEVPPSSELVDAPRVVLRVRAEGAYCRYAHGKLSFSRVTPLATCC